MGKTILPNKRIKQNIKIIDGKRGYFECKNYCDECKGGNCKYIQELMKEDKK